MKLAKMLFAPALICAALVAPVAVAAPTTITFDLDGSTAAAPTFHTVNWAGTLFGSSLSASATFTLTGFGTGSIGSTSYETATFSVSVTNSTPSAQPGDNRLTSIGIDIVNPALAGAQASGNGWASSVNSNITGGYTVDLCAFDGNQCNASPGFLGLDEGATETFTLTLFASDFTILGAGTSDSVQFTSPFVTRWQSIGQGSQGSGIIVVNNGGGTTIIEIPEPATLALVGVSLLGAGVASRRRRSL
jgi:hypothetical protein